MPRSGLVVSLVELREGEVEAARKEANGHDATPLNRGPLPWTSGERRRSSAKQAPSRRVQRSVAPKPRNPRNLERVNMPREPNSDSRPRTT